MVGMVAVLIINDNGYVMTAYHVVDGANKIDVKFSSGLKLKATLVAYDYPNDVAILDITGEGFQALPLNTKDDSGLGINVLTIGYSCRIGTRSKCC